MVLVWKITDDTPNFPAIQYTPYNSLQVHMIILIQQLYIIMYQYYVICKHIIKAEIYYAVVQNIPSHNYYYYVIFCPFMELLPCKVDLYSLINTMLYKYCGYYGQYV